MYETNSRIQGCYGSLLFAAYANRLKVSNFVLDGRGGPVLGVILRLALVVAGVLIWRAN